MNKQKIFAATLASIILTLSLVSAMSIKSVDVNSFQPGSEQDVNVGIKNIFNEDATDVSLNLNLAGLPFYITDSKSNVDEIISGDTEYFDFTVKAASSATAGDYSIPYTLTYTLGNDSQMSTKSGVFTFTVDASPELSYSASVDTPVVGSQGKINLNVVNSGLGEAKFVSVTISPQGYTLLSDSNDYIGTIDSDDSQSVSFNAIFNQPNPILIAKVEYRNFDNQQITDNVELPITVYSKEDALKLGIIKPNNTFAFLILAGLIFGSWVIVKKIRKKRRLNKTQGR